MITLADLAKANTTLLRKLVVVTIVMFGFGFAMVPFYKKICEVSGITELAQADEAVNSQVDTSRWLTLQLDANTRGLPWEFEPMQKEIRVHPGQLIQVSYRVKNTSANKIVGQAIPAYGPSFAGKYVSKLECFCFTRQEFQPHEAREMPVQLVIGTDLPKEVDTVTLSYTFFEVPGNPSLQKAPKG
ncbi:MAG: cytochrome c oxidase assembly protein [Burkholderiales bacterium]